MQRRFPGSRRRSNPLSRDIIRILVVLAAFAMGLQINAVRFLHVPGVSTTAVTATFIALVSAVATWSLEAHAARRLAGVLVSSATENKKNRTGERTL
jgi:uncharacterized membrane protein YoaK (UPF0700 family)